MGSDGRDGDCDPEEAELFAEFFSWARENGALGLEQIRVAPFEKSGVRVRGLAAVMDVCGPIIIPRCLLMTAASADELALRLVCEELKMRSGGESFWSPWIRMVPTRAEMQQEHLVYACEELLEAFAALPVVARVRGWNAKLRETWEGLEEKGFTYDDFRWASAVVLSRVYLPPPTYCFMPFADMMNTGPAPNMQVFDFLEVGESTEAEHYGLLLLEGAELLQAYDEVDNAERLFRGGFLLEDNPQELPRLDDASVRTALELALSHRLPEAEARQPRLLASLRALAREHCAGLE
mmetsp:Transcript_18218/g.57131  ORF Transcript_18218/g.57131 Transcript_18218/m.57131 type:complete len:294 (-) Transcript_18218:57-938(-)